MNTSYKNKNLCFKPVSKTGFTLIEILIALVLSLSIISSIYYVFISNSRVYHQQDQIIEVQTNLRFAQEVVKYDIMRAGYLATTNSISDGRICPKPMVPIHGIAIKEGSSEGDVYLFEKNQIQPDSLILIGNFMDGNLYYPTQINTGSREITLGLQNLPNSLSTFNQIFSPDNLLKITSPNGTSQFLRIQSSDFDSLTVVSQDNIFQQGTDGDCGIEGFGGENHTISVASVVRYRIETDPTDESATNLIRERLSIADGEPILHSSMVVAENIVDFQVWADGIASTSALSNNPQLNDDQVMGDEDGSISNIHLAGGQSRDTQNIRSIKVKMSARTPRQITDFPHKPRTLVENGQQDPLETFELDSNPEDSCQVIAVQFEVEVLNFQYGASH